MSADFGILPSEERRIIDGLDFGQFFQELSNFAGHGVVPQPPSQAVSDRGVATYFSTEVSVSNYATFGRGPAPCGGSEEGHVGLAFNASEKENALRSSTLYGLSPALSHNSPFTSTPPEVYGGAPTWWDGAALPNTTFGPPSVPGVSATVDPRLFNGELSGALAGLYCDNLPAASGHAFELGFGKERVDVSGYEFTFHIPNGQSFHPFSSFPNPQVVPPPAFASFDGQYAAPWQEFVQGSSSDPSPTASAWVPAPRTVSVPFAFGNLATSMSPASLPDSPSAFINHGYPSTLNAREEIFSPRDGITHRNGEIVGPLASSSRPRKRKARSTCSTSSSPKAKAAKLSSESSPSQQEHTEADKDSNHPADSPLSSTEITHKHIDWSRPPTWAGNPIPPMAVEKIFSYLTSTHKVHWDKILRCEYDDCRREFKKAGAVKSHVMGAEHMDLRRKCLRCGWSVREDNFSSRHDTQEKCNRALKRRERRERKKGKK